MGKGFCRLTPDTLGQDAIRTAVAQALAAVEGDIRRRSPSCPGRAGILLAQAAVTMVTLAHGLVTIGVMPCKNEVR